MAAKAGEGRGSGKGVKGQFGGVVSSFAPLHENPTHSNPIPLLFPLEIDVHVLGYYLSSLADQQKQQQPKPNQQSYLARDRQVWGIGWLMRPVRAVIVVVASICIFGCCGRGWVS